MSTRNALLIFFTNPRKGETMYSPINGLVMAIVMAISGICHASPGWLIRCPHDHSLNDDPIVFPGQPGMSHLHDFFGAKDTNANSNYVTMTGSGTSCEFQDDTAGYWVPALYQNGNRVIAHGGKYNGPGTSNGATVRQQIYYRDSNLASGTAVTSFPQDFRMIAGNASATNASENPYLGREIYYGCSDNSTSKLKAPPSSCATGIMSLHVGFPNCWKGGVTNIDSPDHKSHVAYPSSGKCPSTHPVALPRVIMRFEYPVGTTTGTITLASGPPYTAHGDFWNTWKQSTLDSLVEQCLNANVDCGRKP